MSRSNGDEPGWFSMAVGVRGFVLVGTRKALSIAVRNMDARRRVTLLRKRRQRRQASLSLGSLSL
ncbi:MAG TPA: hypothetical protein VM389_02075 [Phycisphaerae bacterium]|nr:hypothetical protein [Phycisphaerae bacterium]HUU21300.1 hypothetical protein [Phycisphaerae bacterium]